MKHDVRKTTQQELRIALEGVGMPVRAETTRNQTHPHTRTYVARKNAQGNYISGHKKARHAVYNEKRRTEKLANRQAAYT